MKKIAIYCVNYNSYKYLPVFSATVDAAAKEVANVADVIVYVADNTEKQIETIDLKMDYAKSFVFPYYENVGYFGAVKRMMEETDVKQFDFVIVSNVDVKLCDDTLSALFNRYKDIDDSIGWIVPQIYSEVEKRDRNPQATTRYSLRRLKLLHFMFKNPWLCFLYKKTAYKRKRLQSHAEGEIYAGHGSFVILTRRYIEKCGIIDYPMFLYCEEIYLAEQCRINGLRVMYDRSVRIIDMEHASTGKMPSSYYCKCNADALEFVIKTFYQ